MNERIRELIKQAGFEENDGHISIQGVYMFNTTRMEKFAELIVQECVRYFNEDYQRDFDTRWREDLSKGIKNHFGVES